MGKSLEEEEIFVGDELNFQLGFAGYVQTTRSKRSRFFNELKYGCRKEDACIYSGIMENKLFGITVTVEDGIYRVVVAAELEKTLGRPYDFSNLITEKTIKLSELATSDVSISQGERYIADFLIYPNLSYPKENDEIYKTVDEITNSLVNVIKAAYESISELGIKEGEFNREPWKSKSSSIKKELPKSEKSKQENPPEFKQEELFKPEDYLYIEKPAKPEDSNLSELEQKVV